MPAATVIAATLTPVWTAVAVSLALTEDTWPTSTTGGWLEVYINGRWQRALDFKHPSKSTGEIAARLDSAAIKLVAATAYSFRVTFKRWDEAGGELESIESLHSATTRDDDPPYGTTGVKYHLSQSGSDLSNDGLSHTTPKRSFGQMNPIIAPGDEIRFAATVNYSPASPSTVYTWDTDRASSPIGNHISGDANNWVRITGYTGAGAYGRAEIQGWIAEPSGAWTQDGATDVYYKGGFAAGERAAIVYDIALDKQLPTCYGNLTTDSGGRFAIKAHTAPGFYFLYDATAANQRLYVRTYDGAAPTNGQFRIAHKLGLIIANADYIIIENMDFSLCATVNAANPLVDSGVYGLHLSSCTNVILRNCTFDHAPLLLNGCTKVLAQNCHFNGSGVWEQHMDVTVNNPYSTSGFSGWSTVKSQVLDRVASGSAGSSQIEYDGCTFSGTANALTINNTTAGFHYLHDCEADKMLDEFVECDNTIIYPLVIANCPVTDTHNFTSFSPGKEGIAWCISCEIRNPLFPTFKMGGGSVSLSQMRVEYVNCTDYRTRPRAVGEGADENSLCLGIAGACGNHHWTNCVTVVNSSVYVFNAGSNDNMTFTTCAIYNLGVATVWRYTPTSYASSALLDAAVSAITFTGLVVNTNPFPTGIDNGVADSLQHAAEDYPGVTNLGRDEDGRRMGYPVRLGAFGGLAWPDYSGYLPRMDVYSGRVVKNLSAFALLLAAMLASSANGQTEYRTAHDGCDTWLWHVDPSGPFVVVESKPNAIDEFMRLDTDHRRRDDSGKRKAVQIVRYLAECRDFVGRNSAELNGEELAIGPVVGRSDSSPIVVSATLRRVRWQPPLVSKSPSQRLYGIGRQPVESNQEKVIVGRRPINDAMLVDHQRLIPAHGRSTSHEQQNSSGEESHRINPLG